MIASVYVGQDPDEREIDGNESTKIVIMVNPFVDAQCSSNI